MYINHIVEKDLSNNKIYIRIDSDKIIEQTNNLLSFEIHIATYDLIPTNFSISLENGLISIFSPTITNDTSNIDNDNVYMFYHLDNNKILHFYWENLINIKYIHDLVRNGNINIDDTLLFCINVKNINSVEFTNNNRFLSDQNKELILVKQPKYIIN